MTRYESRNSDRCSQCGAPVVVEMHGPWSYRVCARNGHMQAPNLGGSLAGAAMVFPLLG